MEIGVAGAAASRDDGAAAACAAPMFHCVILFSLKPGIPLDRVRGAREALQSLVETMPGVEYLVVTHNVAGDRGGFNLALFSAFENQTACEIFLRHPEYQRVWNVELGPLVERHLMAQGDGATVS